MLALLLLLGFTTYLPSTYAQTPLNDIVQVAAGGGHTCGLTTGGGVKCWGNNSYGQLGDGTRIDRFTAVNVSGLTSGVSAIVAGSTHTCALTTGGGVKCWGYNANGRVGDGTTALYRMTAVDVVGLSSGVIAIAARVGHTCALTTAGGVKCWGDNWSGQLGDGTRLSRFTAVDVSGLSSGVSAIAAGRDHTCALTTGGGVKCWGYNSGGQLGDGTTTDRLTAVDVSELNSGVSAIATGDRHTCAVVTGGGVKCWGSNFDGQLGDGSTTDRLTAVDVSGLTSGVVAIATGGYHTCALVTGGGVKCWGSNYVGQLGDGFTTARWTAVDVVGLSSGISAIDTGDGHTCAISMGGSVKCWGSNFDGQLGDGSTTDRWTAVDVSRLGSGVSAVATGSLHSCALTTDGGVKCWGYNENGQLGDGGTVMVRPTAVDVSGLSSGVSAMAAGERHTCALTTGGGVKCWGYNRFGQLGDGTNTNRSTPANVSGLSGGVSAIATGRFHTCALTTGGGVKCWGDNISGQLGDGTTTDRWTAVDVSGLSSGVSAIATGSRHSCAITTGGGVKCWGSNIRGQLGDGTATDRWTAADVSGLSSGVSAIAAGNFYTCALTTGGGVTCWGDNISGQLGDGTTTDRLTAVDVSGLSSGVSAIDAGEQHTCALTTSGGGRCWGRNDHGQLGDGTRTSRLTAVDVNGLNSGLSAIAVGSFHTCALTTSGGVKCWGNNFRGQLGIGGRNYGLPGDVLMSDVLFFNGFENEP